MKKSLGSLAAIAALAAAQQSEAAVVISPISNQTVSNDLYLDIDGNGSNDFYINGGHNVIERVGVGNGVLISSGNVIDLSTNVFINSGSGTFGTSGNLANFLNNGIGYAGIYFSRTVGMTTTNHYGYIEFSSSDTVAENMVVKSAAWESTPDTGITTPVPEPAMMGLFAGLSALALLGLRRKPR